jgi:hypothetical protein
MPKCKHEYDEAEQLIEHLTNQHMRCKLCRNLIFQLVYFLTVGLNNLFQCFSIITNFISVKFLQMACTTACTTAITILDTYQRTTLNPGIKTRSNSKVKSTKSQQMGRISMGNVLT